MKGEFIVLGSSGIFIRGVFVGSDEVVRNYDQRERINYVNLIIIGVDAYKVTSAEDYRDRLAFGDIVTFSLRVRAYNSQVYLNGELVDE